MSFDGAHRRLWFALAFVGSLGLVAGFALSAWTHADVVALILYLTLIAAVFAGVQAYRTRLNSLLPVVVVGHPEFTFLRPDHRRLFASPGELEARDLALRLPVMNVGVGPAINCEMVVWVRATTDQSGNLDLVTQAAMDEEMSTSPDFKGTVVGIGAGRGEDRAWPSTEERDLIPFGNFLVYWRLGYADVFGRTRVATGLAFLQSNLYARPQSEDTHEQIIPK